MSLVHEDLIMTILEKLGYRGNILRYLLILQNFFPNELSSKKRLSTFLKQFKKEAELITKELRNNKRRFLNNTERQIEAFREQFEHPAQRNRPFDIVCWNYSTSSFGSESEDSEDEFGNLSKNSNETGENDSLLGKVELIDFEKVMGVSLGTEEDRIKMIYYMFQQRSFMTDLLIDGSLKLVVERQLEELGFKFEKNVVSYPFKNDFEFESSQGIPIALNVISLFPYQFEALLAILTLRCYILVKMPFAMSKSFINIC